MENLFSPNLSTFFVLMLLGFAFAVVILKLLWNSTLPELFGFKEITFVQAFKIMVLSMLLTGGGTSLVSFTTQTTSNTTYNEESPVSSTHSTSNEVRLGK